MKKKGEKILTAMGVAEKAIVPGSTFVSACFKPRATCASSSSSLMLFPLRVEKKMSYEFYAQRWHFWKIIVMISSLAVTHADAFPSADSWQTADWDARSFRLVHP